MEISFFELKILRYISRLSKRKQKSFSNELLEKKFGAGVRYAVKSLYEKGYICCPEYSGSENGVICAALPVMDSWQITGKGLCCIAENRLKITLTSKERLINFFYGFASGFLAGFAVQLALYYLIRQ